jgi:hypothetical protein
VGLAWCARVRRCAGVPVHSEVGGKVFVVRVVVVSEKVLRLEMPSSL